jgi:hypothetical protein
MVCHQQLSAQQACLGKVIAGNNPGHHPCLSMGTSVRCTASCNAEHAVSAAALSCALIRPNRANLPKVDLPQPGWPFNMINSCW